MMRKLKLEPAAPTHTGFRAPGLAGIGFAVLIVLGNVILVPAGLPRTGAETTEVTEFFGTQGTAVGVATAFGPLIWILASLFGAGAVSALWQAHHQRVETWSLAGFAGILLQNLTFTGVVAIRLALASMDGDDGTAANGLWALHDALFTLNGTFLALALVGLSVSGMRAGLIRTWHGRLGLVAAALQFGSATLAPLVVEPTGQLGLLGLTGWLLWVVWLVAYGVALIRPAPTTRSGAVVAT